MWFRSNELLSIKIRYEEIVPAEFSSVLLEDSDWSDIDELVFESDY